MVSIEINPLVLLQELPCEHQHPQTVVHETRKQFFDCRILS